MLIKNRSLPSAMGPTTYEMIQFCPAGRNILRFFRQYFPAFQPPAQPQNIRITPAVREFDPSGRNRLQGVGNRFLGIGNDFLGPGNRFLDVGNGFLDVGW
jgi:hypothetical protein